MAGEPSSQAPSGGSAGSSDSAEGPAPSRGRGGRAGSPQPPPLPHEQIRFAHNSERQFAKLLDFYGIVWEYEPRTFVLEWDRDGHPQQAFSPDFYLPAYDLFIEITTMNQKLVTKKNRKVRRLREVYPDTRIQIFYQRDYLNLLVKYGLEEPSAAMPPVDESVEPLPLRFDDLDTASEQPPRSVRRRRRKPA